MRPYLFDMLGQKYVLFLKMYFLKMGVSVS